MTADLKTQIATFSKTTSLLQNELEAMTFQYSSPQCFVQFDAKYNIRYLRVDNKAVATELTNELIDIFKRYGRELGELDKQTELKLKTELDHNKLDILKIYYQTKTQKIEKFKPIKELCEETIIQLSSPSLLIKLRSNIVLTDFSLEVNKALTDVGLFLSEFNALYPSFLGRQAIEFRKLNK